MLRASVYAVAWNDCFMKRMFISFGGLSDGIVGGFYVPLLRHETFSRRVTIINTMRYCDFYVPSPCFLVMHIRYLRYRVAGDNGPLEKHPEKRLKAAYMAYEERMLPKLRNDNPGMRLSQLKQLVFKSFQTCPENPKNQEHVEYNMK